MPQYWHVAEALVMLAKHLRHATTTFTRADLVAWSERFKERPRGAQQALDQLALSCLVRRTPKAEGTKPVRQGAWTYTLTPEGMVAAKEAYKAWKHHVLSEAGAKGTRPRSKGSFGARLWSLFRMRKLLSAPEAAATLVDAGGNVATATNTAGQYLRLWAQQHPEAVQVSKQRSSDKSCRYVLIKDLGPTPPVTTYPKKAQGGAAA